MMHSITAEDLLAFYRCRRLPYLQRYGPQAEKRPPEGFVIQLRQEREQLRAEVGVEFPGSTVQAQGSEEREAETLALMQAKVERIYLGNLRFVWRDQAVITSRPDLLSWQSDPGFYLPIEIRTGKRMKPEYELGLAIHAQLLGHLQGITPLRGTVILRDQHWYSVKLHRRYSQIDQLIQDFVEMLDRAELPLVFMARSRCNLCSWQTHCRQLAAVDRPLTLLPGVTGNRYPLLQSLGIESISALAAASLTALEQTAGLGSKLSQQLIRQAQATLHQQPVWIERRSLPTDPVELYFDIEADPHRQVAYLLGVLVVDRIQNQTHYHACLAETPQQEAKGWQMFLQVVMTYPQAPIYHFHVFEVQTCQQLGQRYGTDPQIIAALVARLIDLQAWVGQTVALPIESYSLKHIARWLGFSWRQSEASGSQSIVWYSQWLQTQDRQFLNATLIYNEDDCQATYQLKRWLESATQEH